MIEQRGLYIKLKRLEYNSKFIQYFLLPKISDSTLYKLWDGGGILYNVLTKLKARRMCVRRHFLMKLKIGLAHLYHDYVYHFFESMVGVPYFYRMPKHTIFFIEGRNQVL